MDQPVEYLITKTPTTKEVKTHNNKQVKEVKCIDSATFTTTDNNTIELKY